MEAVHCAVTQNSLKRNCSSEISGLSQVMVSLVYEHVSAGMGSIVYRITHKLIIRGLAPDLTPGRLTKNGGVCKSEGEEER